MNIEVTRLEDRLRREKDGIEHIFLKRFQALELEKKERLAELDRRFNSIRNSQPNLSGHL